MLSFHCLATVIDLAGLNCVVVFGLGQVELWLGPRWAGISLACAHL